MATIRWCPIYPKWDSYQPLIGSYYCGDIPVWFHYDRHKFTWVCLKIGYPKLHSLSSHSLFKWPFMGIQYPPFLDPDTLRYWFIVWSLWLHIVERTFLGKSKSEHPGKAMTGASNFKTSWTPLWCPNSLVSYCVYQKLKMGVQLLIQLPNVDRPARIDIWQYCLSSIICPSFLWYHPIVVRVVFCCVYVGCDSTVSGLVVHPYVVGWTICISISILDISNVCWYIYISGIWNHVSFKLKVVTVFQERQCT